MAIKYGGKKLKLRYPVILKCGGLGDKNEFIEL